MRTRLEINGVTIPVSEELQFNINKSIVDIREPDKRNFNFTKTVQIPGSKEITKLFGFIFEIDIDGTFNPNLKADAVIYIDEIEQERGYIQLLQVTDVDETKVYECAIYGQVANLFKNIGENYLSSLDLSAYDHAYTRANIEASWTATIGEGYVYPLIDYGYSSNSKDFPLEGLFPAIYAKQYLDSIFAAAGMTYQSTFLTSNFFKRLIVPMSGEYPKLTDTQVNNELFNVGMSGNITPSLVTSGTIVVPFDDEGSPFFDNGGHWDNTTYEWSPTLTGNYWLQAIIDMRVAVTSGTVSGNLRVWAQVELNGVAINSSFVEFNQLGLPFSGNRDRTARVLTRFSNLQPTDVVRVTLFYINTLSGSYTFTIFDTSETFNGFQDTRIMKGGTMPINSTLPTKVKQKDFLMSLVKCFNLMFEVDKENPNKIHIEPREDYYSAGQTKDWHQKIATERPIEIIPMGELNAIRYLFTFNDDTDDANKRHKDLFELTYGAERRDITNDFITETKEIKPIFAASPAVESYDRVITRIVSTNSNGNVKAITSQLRLLYYSGLKITNDGWTLIESGGFGPAGIRTNYTTYPQAIHLDDHITPTVDINFGVPEAIYYPTQISSYTNNNLYNKYWSRYIEQISDKDSKIMRCEMDLTPQDIYQLDFRDNYFIQGSYFILNKIIDYNPVVNRLTKCEFLKLNFKPNFVPATSPVNGGTGTIGNNKKPIFQEIIATNNNQKPQLPTGGISGEENDVQNSGGGVLLAGTGNKVHDDFKRVLIVGSDNTVLAGLENVIILNADGLTPLRSDYIAIGTPINLIEAPLLETPEKGAIEYDGIRLSFTPISQRRGIMLSTESLTNTTTVTAPDSVGSPIEIASIDFDANSLHIGRTISYRALGRYTTTNAVITFDIVYSIDGTEVARVTSPTGVVSDAPIDTEFILTIRTEGVSGSARSYVKIESDNLNKSVAGTSDQTVDTTAGVTLTIDIEWSDATSGNSVSIDQGYGRIIN